MEGIDYSNSATVVCYHADCLDGFGAALVFYLARGEEATYVPVEYNKEEKLIELAKKYSHMIFVDFCPELETLYTIVQELKRFVTVLDHHVSRKEVVYQAIRELPPTRFCGAYSDKLSGVGLAWEYSFPNKKLPALLAAVQDKDLWKFELPHTKEICAALASGAVQRNFQEWKYLVLEADIYDLVVIGRAVLAEQQRRVDAVLRYAHNIVIEGDGLSLPSYTGLAVQCELDIRSEVGHALAERSGTFGAAIFYLGNGKHKVSLRSLDAKICNVAAIAESFGGGGHKEAASFNLVSSNPAHTKRFYEVKE